MTEILPPPQAGRAVVTDEAEGIRVTLFRGADAVAVYDCSPHLAIDLASELLLSARRGFGRDIRRAVAPLGRRDK